ncbi:MAG: hypothetical protein ACRDSZ_11600 [Pseudonocardiaceae bacterium]
MRIRAEHHRRGNPVAVPLFGAPRLSEGTRTLVAAAALAGPPTLIVDDLTPRFCYRTYPVADTRAHYQHLADDHHGRVRFLTELPDLADRIDQVLDTLTHADVRIAAGPRAHRRRGALTGFDAVHLATMGVCCTATDDDTLTLAVKSSNVAHLRALTPLGLKPRLLTCTGTGTLATADLRVPAHWLTSTPGVH